MADHRRSEIACHERPAGRILLTGATGYVGGRLLRKLEEAGRPVRCMARRPEVLSGRVGEQTEIVHGDILDRDSLHRPLSGATVAYYLVHSMAASGPFAGADRRGAENFAAAARECGVSRIVYLGGLGAEDDVSTHLESRHEVGQILRESGVPTIEFRASIVIGSGSSSFEIVRSLVDRSPVLLIPRWVVSHTQPIAIEDVLAYLLAALDLEVEESRLFEIGGPDRVTYADLMQEYARQAGLRRAVIRVPLATPRISGLWLSVVTPVYASIGRKLIDGLRNDTVVHDRSAREAFPIRPRGYRQAIKRALANEDREFAETRWSDALSAHRGRNWGGVTFGQRAVASRKVRVAASPEQTFAPIQRIGGETGWYYANGFWRLRGLLDKLVGGVGLRRGRRDPVRLAVGDTLDFWRVEVFEQDRLLRLGAEMKAPGRIWLQFEVDGDQAGTTLYQTAIFDPHGLAGLAYWYTLYPVHYLIFEGMLRRIGQAAIVDTRSKQKRNGQSIASWRTEILTLGGHMKRLIALFGSLAALITVLTHPSPGAASPAKGNAVVSSAPSRLGRVLVDRRGRALYLFEKDAMGKSSCAGACASYWPPLLTSGKPLAETGVRDALLGVTRRADGRLQVTYNHHPLYTFKLDAKAGQTNGQNLHSFGADWYVLSPAGVKIERNNSTKSKSSSSNTGSYGYGP
jgi:uncharacterized protein YbjT (DUF2867 family)/predicted lipoprotein with Yx(FWY)xxD motif